MSEDLSGEIKPGESIEVVGIVPATRTGLFESDATGVIYVPFGRGFQSNISFFVRFRTLAPGSETATADLLRRTVREVDSALPILSLKTFAQHLESNFQLWIVRAGAAMFSVFGGLALGLAVVGLYGVKAYSVARRTREIGIRMALGAQREQIRAQFLSLGLRLLAAGTILGLIGAWMAGRAMQSVLFGVPTLHIATLLGTALVMSAVSLIACLIPARRATKVDPMIALRAE
jgi:ABC-type antimicrobial peptide transport system permease subunit